MWTTIVN